LKGRENILELKQALQTKNSIYIVTELCSRGTLRDLLVSQRRLPEVTAVALIRQLINGYISIHGQGLVHRDIKPDNLFLTANHQLRIGDFGFAIRAEECGEALK
jgi:serine/threonine-protein kinase